MKKVKILVIAPYEGMRDLMMGIAEQRQDIDLTVLCCNVEDVGDIITRPENSNFSAIISRGGTAKQIESMTHLPISEIPVSVYDVLRAIKIAQNYNGKFAIVAVSSITKVAQTLCDVLQYDVDIITIDREENPDPILKKLTQDNFSLIVGDTRTVSHARKLGLNGILIMSGCESLEIAIDRALVLVSQRERIRHSSEICNALLEYNPQRIIALDAVGNVCYSNVSTDMQDQLVSILRKHVPRVLDAGFIDQTHLSGDTVSYIRGSRMTLTFGTIAAFFIRNAKLNIHNENGVILVFQHEDVQEQFVNSFYNSLGVFPEEVFVMAHQIGNNTNPLVICGEEGTGKEHLAMYIYLNGCLRNNSYILIDCDKTTSEHWNALLANEASPLCGTNTTIFISNLQQLSEENMYALLNFLQGSAALSCNQFIFSYKTYGGNLQSNSTINKYFNELNCLMIQLPPLRERSSILPNMLSLAISNANAQFGKSVIGFNPDATELLRQYAWPQNLDQFLRVVKQSILLCNTPYVSEKSVRYVLEQEQKRDGACPFTFDTNRSLAAIERDIVLSVFREEGMNQSRTAKRLDISRTTLWRMLK